MWSSIESQECDPQHGFEFEPTLILLYPHGLQEELGSIGVKKDVSWWRCGRSGRDPAGVSSHVREPFLDPLTAHALAVFTGLYSHKMIYPWMLHLAPVGSISQILSRLILSCSNMLYSHLH